MFVIGTTYRTNLQLHPAEIPENTHKTRKNTEIRLDFSILGVEICSGHQNSLERSFEPLLRGIFSQVCLVGRATNRGSRASFCRSEEHTSELQSRGHLVCRLL